MMSRRVHSLVGLIPLGFFSPYHLWENWAALSGRYAWLDRERLGGAALGAVVGLIFGLSLAVHIWFWPRGPENRSREFVGSQALRQLQRMTGIAFLLFLGYHIHQVLPAILKPELFGSGAYGILWDELGEPLVLGIYVIGVSALCFHVGHGWCRAAVTWRLLSRPASVNKVRYLAATVSFVLWALALQIVSHFAIGQALFGG